MNNQISIDDLKSYLWNSAILLRTHIDAGSYKQYVFPILFFKRLCDVYNEEYEVALKESDGDSEYAEFAENHRFVIPKGYHWQDVRETTADIGKALQKAFYEIERANPKKLHKVFGDAVWTNKNRLTDTLLKDLIEHFSSKTLSIANCPEDELGIGYEYLIKKFADDSGHTAQEFYTNRTVVHLMTEMLQPQSEESIYDPTCGSAGMLISAVAYLKAKKKEWRNLKIYGQELNYLTSAIGKMNLFLHGVKDFTISNDDTLTSPSFIENGKLKKFDLVLANPPYSIKQWNRDAFANDKYGRNFLGTPPQGRADYAFFQHILESLNPKTGRCAILFPHGVLSRISEKGMRKKLIELDLIECIIGLGKNLFFNSPMEACIVICRANKKDNKKDKILFIDARNEVLRNNSESYLTSDHIKNIASSFRLFDTKPWFSYVASKEEIVNNEYSLSVSVYVKKEPDNLASTDINEVIADWLESSDKLRDSYQKVLNSLFKEGDNNE